MDMKYFVWPWGTLEWHIASAIYAQLSHRYELSSWDTAGATDSKIADEQPCIEGVYPLPMAALNGGNTIHASHALISTDKYCVEYIEYRRRLR